MECFEGGGTRYGLEGIDVGGGLEETDASNDEVWTSTGVR